MDGGRFVCVCVCVCVCVTEPLSAGKERGYSGTGAWKLCGAGAGELECVIHVHVYCINANAIDSHSMLPNLSPT